MNKKFSNIFSILILIMIVLTTTVSNGSEEYNSKEIRIGLKQYYENVSNIKVNNKSIILGYSINGEWIPEHTFISNTGFVFKPTRDCYLISEKAFVSYNLASSKVNLLRDKGYSAYVGTASKGIWKIYIGGVNSLSELEKIHNKVDNLFDLNYEIVSDNGYRTVMEYSQGSEVILENTFQHPNFSSNDLVNNIPIINLGQRKYRGKIEIGRYNEDGVTAINIINLDEYLYSVIPSEVIPSWPIEAIKAQAVAARNYAIYYTEEVSKYSNKSYDLCDTVNSQVYKGYDVENLNCTKAVDDTKGKLLYYGGSIIPTFYFSSSGGHTENSENVWSGTVPYLKGVPDIYETEPERKPWILQLSANEIKEKLAKFDVNIGTIKDIKVLKYSDSGRVMKLNIIGSNGEYTISKETMRYWLGFNSRKFSVIKSGDRVQKDFYSISADGKVGQVNYDTAYVVNSTYQANLINNGNDQLMIMGPENIYNFPMIYSNTGEFIFAGSGWGHGVGLSQSGSKGMAKEGFTYEEILEYYFTGTEVR